jgi:hypothetical protein
VRDRTREACAQELGRVFIRAADTRAPIGTAGSVWLQPVELREWAQRDLPWDWLYAQLHRWVMANIIDKRLGDSLDPDGRRPDEYRLRRDGRKLVERWLVDQTPTEGARHGP